MILITCCIVDTGGSTLLIDATGGTSVTKTATRDVPSSTTTGGVLIFGIVFHHYILSVFGNCYIDNMLYC